MILLGLVCDQGYGIENHLGCIRWWMDAATSTSVYVEVHLVEYRSTREWRGMNEVLF